MSIKQSPEDFFVEEVLTAEAAGRITQRPGPLAVYRLSKTSLSTPEALAMLERALHVPAGAVGVGGLKDKHATTIQHVSVDFSASDRPGPGGGPNTGPRTLSGRNWKIERLGWIDKHLDGSAIAANRFRIEVFDLSARDCEMMDGAAELLEVGCAGSRGGCLPRGSAHRPNADPVSEVRCAEPSLEKTLAKNLHTLQVVNYFGSQRFGSARGGEGFPARHLIEGNFERALRMIIALPARQDRPEDKRLKQLTAGHWGKWAWLLPRLSRWPFRPAVAALAEGRDMRAAFAALPYFTQQMNVEAYQSYLWNLTAARLLGEQCPPDGVWEVDDPIGLMTLRFAAASAVPADLAKLDLPLLGPKTALRGVWADAAKAVLAEEQISVAQLKIPGLHRPFFGELPRPLFMRAEEFAMSEPSPDRKPNRRRRTVSFLLGRGCYATIVLAAMGQ